MRLDKGAPGAVIRQNEAPQLIGLQKGPGPANSAALLNLEKSVMVERRPVPPVLATFRYVDRKRAAVHTIEQNTRVRVSRKQYQQLPNSGEKGK